MRGKRGGASEGADVQGAVEAAWRHALGVEAVDESTNFFAAGGDSLAGMSLIAEIQERLGITATFADLLEAPTVEEFVALLPSLDRAPAEPRSSRRSGAVAPMTRLQQARWKQRRRPVPGAEVSWLYRIDGRLDVDALCGAVDELVRRHEILRTTFRRRWGRPRQIVLPWKPGYVRTVDMTTEPRKQREQAALRLVVEQDYRAFDYEKGPLIRATVVKLADDSHLFSLACCEMVVDGSSRRLVAVALTTLYQLLAEGKDVADYPYPARQFTWFARARRELVSGSSYLEQVAYWQARLRSVDAVVPIPDWRESPTEGRAIERQALHLSRDFMQRVDESARGMGQTPFVLLAAAFAALFGSVSGRDDVVFTTTLAHRDTAGAEDMIGTFYNNVFVIVDLRGIVDAKGLVEATAVAARESFRHGEMPLSQAETFLPSAEDASSGLRVGAIRFQLHEYPGEMRFGALRAHRVRLPAAGGPDLAVQCTKSADGGLDIELYFRPELPRRLANELLPAYRRIVTALVDNPAKPMAEVLRAGGRSSPVKAAP